MTKMGINQRLYDVEYRKLISPQLAPKEKSFDEWITADSEKWQRKMVRQLRRYQAKECDDGNAMDESDELWSKVEVRSLTREVRNSADKVRDSLIGCVCFERYDSGNVQLQFCWIHPFYRNKGELKNVWWEFELRYGEFYVSEPRSKAMEGFLKSVNYQEPN